MFTRNLGTCRVFEQGLAQPKHRSGRRKMFDHLTGIGWNWDKLQSFGNISNELYPNFWKLSPWSYSNKPSMALSIGGCQKRENFGTVHWNWISHWSVLAVWRSLGLQDQSRPMCLLAQAGPFGCCGWFHPWKSPLHVWLISIGISTD